LPFEQSSDIGTLAFIDNRKSPLAMAEELIAKAKALEPEPAMLGIRDPEDDYDFGIETHKCGGNNPGWSRGLRSCFLKDAGLVPHSDLGGILLSMKVGVAAISFGIVLLCGCYSNNTDALREHTADATAAAKRDAGAIAAGVIEGLTRKGPTDINRASNKDLQRLPGITPDAASAIIAGRPYDDTSQLVRKHILSKTQYSRIRSQIVVK
jgi:hypothetical protein